MRFLRPGLISFVPDSLFTSFCQERFRPRLYSAPVKQVEKDELRLPETAFRERAEAAKPRADPPSFAFSV